MVANVRKPNRETRNLNLKCFCLWKCLTSSLRGVLVGVVGVVGALVGVDVVVLAAGLFCSSHGKIRAPQEVAVITRWVAATVEGQNEKYKSGWGVIIS